jgi:predicted nuclease with RNAse H fold
MICDRFHIGTYSHCDEITIEVIDEPITLHNRTTGRSCEYLTSELGYLAPGDYAFDLNAITYTFYVT